MNEEIKEKEAEKIARKIKRVLNSVPDGFIVTIHNTTVSVSDEDEYYKYVNENGHADNPPTMAYEVLNTTQIVGNGENN